MTLEMLLEEKNSVGRKIDGALKKIGEWFSKKAESVKEKFESVKEKVSGKIAECKEYLEKSLGVKFKVPVDIEFDKYNYKTIKKLHGRLTLPEILREIVTIFKEMMDLFKKDCMSVIEICKYGASEVMKIKNRRNDRDDITEAYTRLGKKQKEAVIRFEDVQTGTECIEKNLGKVRLIKHAIREAIAADKKNTARVFD